MLFGVENFFGCFGLLWLFSGEGDFDDLISILVSLLLVF